MKRRYCEIIFILTIGLIAVCPFAALPNIKGTNQLEGSYVILTNINQNDAYYSAIPAFQSYRGATIIRFNSLVSESLSTLKTLTPKYVAVAVKPQTITVDFVADTYNTLRHIDTDEFFDTAFGFITAANAADMANLLSNTINAESQAKPQKYASMVYSQTTFGGVMQRSEVYRDLFSSVGWNTTYVDTYNKTSLIYDKLSKCSLITVDMHGTPEYVEGLSSTEVKAGPSQFLFPAVAISSPCYSANTYNVTSNCEECLSSYIMDPSNSFALSFINRGAIGYIGHMLMYGPNWYLLENVLNGIAFLNMTQGEAISYALNSKLCSSYVDYTHNFTTSYNWLSDPRTMLFGYVLYGRSRLQTSCKPSNCTNGSRHPHFQFRFFNFESKVFQKCHYAYRH